jgi:acetyl-CoA carboxylase beta subunit
MKKYKDLTKAEKEEIKVTVCPSCHKASCISADHPCDDFWDAGEWQETLIDLEKLRLEHSDHWQADIDRHFEEKK